VGALLLERRSCFVDAVREVGIGCGRHGASAVGSGFFIAFIIATRLFARDKGARDSRGEG
jgi:hypothetical protein